MIIVSQYLHLFSVLIEMNSVLHICTVISFRLMNDLWDYVGTTWFAHNLLITQMDFSISNDNFANGSLFHILIICSFQVTTHLQYGLHFNKCIAEEQIPYFALTIKKLAITTNNLPVTIRSLPFYQWIHAVSMNQLGSLLSIWRKINSPISVIAPLLMNPVIHTY